MRTAAPRRPLPTGRGRRPRGRAGRLKAPLRGAGLVPAFLLAFLLASCGSSDGLGPDPGPVGLPIDMPSAAESAFAERRDITVVGYFDPPLDHPGDVRVEIFAGGEATGTPLRVVRSHVDPATGTTPRGSLDFSYSGGQAWGPDGAVSDPLAMVMTPDLVATPGGLADPTNKVVVTNEYYAAVVLGGVTRDFDTSYEDDEGTSWTDLTAGVYTLRVTGESGDLAGLTGTRRLGFGTTDAMLGRFSPPGHRERLLAAAHASGLRTYTDFFPGFFSHAGYAYEIAGRWMPNNSIEVVNHTPPALIDGVDAARNDILLYNIPEHSATNRIEIGAIAAYGLLDSDRTTFHYYALGEPSLDFVRTATREAVSVASPIATMDPFDRLVLTRGEIEAAGREPSEGLYDVIAGRSFDLVADFSADVVVEDAALFSVFGVVGPIPTMTSGNGTPAHHVLGNTVTAIRYVFTDRSMPAPAVLEELRAVGLRRRFDPTHAPDAYAQSMYEFEHEFPLSGSALPVGSYVVTLQCLDADGEPVAGGTEAFGLVVASPVRTLP